MKVVLTIVSYGVLGAAGFGAVGLWAQAPLEGVKVGDIDHSVDACQDFDAFANGAWRKEHPMPAIQTTWARRNVAQDETLDKLKTLLVASSSKQAPKGSADQLIGDFYGSCTNESQIDSLGLKPLQPLLAGIDAIQDRKSLTAELV